MRRDSNDLVKGDEISIFELLRMVCYHKTMIFAITIASILSAAVYTFTINPIYEARVYIIPPSSNDILDLNKGRGDSSGLGLITPSQVYATYLESLSSESLKKDFYDSVYLASSSNQIGDRAAALAYSKFQEQVRVVKDTGDKYYVQFEALNLEQGLSWAFAYSQLAGERARKYVISYVENDARNVVKNLEQKIRRDRDRARLERADQIAFLREAAGIAKSLGIEKGPALLCPAMYTPVGSLEGSLAYMRGSKALEAEIFSLENRKSDDPYIKNLRESQGVMEFYSNIEINPSNVRLYQVESSTNIADAPVKTRKSLIIIVGGVFGFFLALLLTLVHQLWLRHSRVGQ